MSSEQNSVGSIIKNATAQKLFQLLNSISDSKDLILDKELICSLDFIATFSQLKDCNVEKVYKLEPGNAPGTTSKCVYLVKPSISNTKIIADHINASRSTGAEKSFWIIHVPRKLCISELVLEREGVYGYVKLLEFPIGFLTLDEDVFSLEIPDFFETFYLKGDLTYVHTAATALVQLFKICGTVPRIFGQGRCAKMVMDLTNRILKEIDVKSLKSDKVSDLIILDRDIDYVSVLLSQLTYEGMLDDFFGIKSGRIVFPKEVTGKEPVKVVLNSSDAIFQEIRNNYFATVFSYLGNKAKELQAKSNVSTMSLNDVKSFVSNEMKKFRLEHTSLSLHIGACEVILQAKQKENFQERLRIESDILSLHNLKGCVEYAEDLICKQVPFSNALKLMCLMSISQDGFMSNEYASLFTQFRQSYGCEYILTLFKLKKLGMLIEQPPLLPPSNVRQSKITEVASKQASQIAEKVATAVAFPKFSSFRTITKRFNLIPEEETTDLKNPKDMSYVFGGTYVPLVGKLTEQVILHGSIKNVEEGLKLLPGPSFSHFEEDKKSGYVEPPTEMNSRTVIVYVLGGITFAEVAALRLLSHLNKCNILIATTSLTNGDSLLKMLSPEDIE